MWTPRNSHVQVFRQAPKLALLQFPRSPFAKDSEDLAYEFYSALRYRRVAKVEAAGSSAFPVPSLAV